MFCFYFYFQIRPHFWYPLFDSSSWSDWASACLSRALNSSPCCVMCIFVCLVLVPNLCRLIIYIVLCLIINMKHNLADNGIGKHQERSRGERILSCDVWLLLKFYKLLSIISTTLALYSNWVYSILETNLKLESFHMLRQELEPFEWHPGEIDWYHCDWRQFYLHIRKFSESTF